MGFPQLVVYTLDKAGQAPPWGPGGQKDQVILLVWEEIAVGVLPKYTWALLGVGLG